jgi:hypothetical protein
MDFMSGGTELIVPRGTPNLPPLTLAMGEIYAAEGRIHEVSFVNETTGTELAGFFNQATLIVGKYLGWIEYEILQAEKYLEEAKSDVIIDQAPEYAKKLKDTGMKMSEDIRAALVVKDPIYSKRLEILNGLKALKVFLKEKHDSFKRAYYSCDAKINGPRGVPGKRINGSIGMTLEPQNNLMGAPSPSALDASVLEIYDKK